MANQKIRVKKTPLYVNGLGLPVQYRNIKSNPNNEENDLLFWIIINSILIFFIISILLNNAIIGSITWLLDYLTFKYVGQFLLFIIILGLDVFIVTMLRNMNVLNGGLISVILYYILDYLYFSKEMLNISLLNWSLSN